VTEREIFFEALEMTTPQARAAYLQGACGQDVTLRRKVEELLKEHFSDDSLLAGSALEGERATLKLEFALEAAPAQMIGRYKLLEKIGEGGFGEVWMAEQREPVKRRVALKIIKPGMDSRQVVARFEAERQALAMMDHANIAKIFDAGTTDTGRPYFVMELVRGMKITDYCDQQKLDTHQRLELVILVCQAIQHAHQKGIIHRDIKPSNILVTLHDGVPVPKVIDFGIAKATQQELTDKTVFTQFQQFMGTPAYISPEQAEMSGLDIDTRADIYSLGVLLYELLVGQTPFDAKEMMKGGIDALRQIIREKEPLRPSTKLNTLQGDARTTAGKRRQSDVGRLVHQVQGDLDWIVMKCLEKDRQRRYDTANGLAADIQRHMNNEPVMARPPSKLYEFQKTVKRHKIGFAAAGGVILALAVGLGIATWTLVKEKRARERADNAEQEQKRQRQIAESKEKQSQEVAEFLKDMLKGVGPSVALGRDTILLREILDQTGARITTDLKGQPAAEAELCYTIGNTYYDIAEYRKAEAMHRRALQLRESIFGPTNLLVAASLSSLASALAIPYYNTNAEVMQRRALAIQRTLLGNETPEVADSLNSLANIIFANRPNHPRTGEAEAIYREALSLRQKIFTNYHPSIAQTLNDLGVLLWRRGSEASLKESEKLLSDALAMRKRLFGDCHPSVAETEYNLAGALRDRGHWDGAEPLLVDSLAIRKKLLGEDHPQVMTTLRMLAGYRWITGKLAEAEFMYKQELSIRRKHYGSSNNPTAVTLIYLGMVIKRQGRFAEAEPLFRESLEIRTNLFGSKSKIAASSVNYLASVLIEQGKAEAAEALLKQELLVLRKQFPDYWMRFWAEHLLGCSVMLQKRYSEAEPLLTSGYLGMKERFEWTDAAMVDLHRPDIDTARIWVSKFYEQTGQADKAAEWKRKLDEKLPVNDKKNASP
jgi:serine/threonine protein kinase